MRKLILIVIATLICQVAFAQPRPSIFRDYQKKAADYNIAGEHTAVIWENIFSWGGDSAVHSYNEVDYPALVASDTIVSPWFYIGYTPNAISATHPRMFVRQMQNLNPEIFRAKTKLMLGKGAGDSLVVSKAYFEIAKDTTDIHYTNADSSHIFIADGNYTSQWYGNGQYEDIRYLHASIDSLGVVHNLRVTSGGWMRVIVESTAPAGDTTFVVMDIWGEN